MHGVIPTHSESDSLLGSCGSVARRQRRQRTALPTSEFWRFRLLTSIHHDDRLSMPPFQIEVAVALGVCLAVSLVLFAALAPKEGQIKLPFYGDGEGSDPFDVTVPADFIDGIPINEECFWERVSEQVYLLAYLRSRNRCALENLSSLSFSA